MATRFAIQNGNWASGSTWNGFYALGFPTAADDVYTNSYTVNVDQNISVLSLNSSTTPLIVDNIATPPMTSNATPSGFVFASTFNTGQEPFRAFAQDGSTVLWQTSTGAVPHIITYQFPTARNIKKYAIKTATVATSTPRQWTLEASNDNITYTVLERVTSSLAINSNYTSAILANTASFTFYRVNVTATGTPGNALQISEIELTESTGSGAGNLSGGSFNFNTPNVSASVSAGITAGATNLITVTATTGTVNISAPNATIIGAAGTTSQVINHSGACDFTITGSSFIGGTATNSICISKSSTGTIRVIGNISGATSPTNAGTQGLSSTNGNTVVIGNITGGGNSTGTGLSQTAGSIDIRGNIIGGSGATGVAFSGASLSMTGSVTGGSVGVGINITSTPTVNISGSVIGASAVGISAATAATINITGSVAGAAASAISLTGASVLTVNGTVTAGSGANGILSISTSATNRLTGPFITGPTGIQPFYGPKLTIITGSATYWTFTSPNVAINKTLYSTDLVSGVPSPSDVRQGVTYASGALTGTMIVPSTSSVAFGVPVDTFTGSAIIVGSNYNVSNEIWNTPVTSLTGSSTIGERLKNNATVASTGAQIAAMAGL